MIRRRSETPRCKQCGQRFRAPDPWALTCEDCIAKNRAAETARRAAQHAAWAERADTGVRRVVGHTAPQAGKSAPEPKRAVVASRQVRDSARGEACTVQHPATCTHDPTTVVLAHLPCDVAGYKSTDVSSAFACTGNGMRFGCHNAIDAIGAVPEFEADREWILRRAMVRTLTRMIEKGVLKYAGQPQ